MLAISGIAIDLPKSEFQLSDGTWVMPRVPVPDLGIWREWIGSIRTGQLQRANLVLLAEEPSTSPEIFDGVHKTLMDGLGKIFNCLHLRPGVECAETNPANMLAGSSQLGMPDIRHMGILDSFYQTRGYRKAPITADWLEETVTQRSGMKLVVASGNHKRLIRGLNVLFDGLRENFGQERVHQFVRSLEALILPQAGKTKRQFVSRCQTLATPSTATASLLAEAFDMRSDTEHLNDWDRTVQSYPAPDREDVCLQRTRQMEQLACAAYSRLLKDSTLREHFQTEDRLADFWNLSEARRRAIWGSPIDIAVEPRFSSYLSNGRAISTNTLSV